MAKWREQEASHSVTHVPQTGVAEGGGGIRAAAVPGRRGEPANRASRERRPVIAWLVAASP